MHPLFQLVMTYLSGPFAVLATSEGRRSGLWMAIGLTSGIAWATVPLRWEDLLFQIRDPGFAIWAWLVTIAVVTISGYTAWAWAILQSGRALDSAEIESPGWTQNPWTAGWMGFVVPGLGLQVAGYRRHAAAAFWLAGPLLLSVLFLSRASWLWNMNVAAGTEGIPGSTVEWIFLGALAVGTVCGLGWIIQGLDGMRRTQEMVAPRSRGHGDRVAVALIVALIVSAFAFQPAQVARNLDHEAIGFQESGYRVIPLLMTQTAARLDSSRPEYAIHEIELYRMMGQDTHAESVRLDLDRRLSSYVTVLRREGWRDVDVAPVTPVPGVLEQPTADATKPSSSGTLSLASP